MTYKILASNLDSNEFYFSTSENIIFRITVEEVSDDAIHSLKWFDIAPVNAENPPFDNVVAITVARFIKDYINQNNCSIVFTCDTSDGRESSRFKKFDSWYQKYNDGSFLKYDKIIINKTTKKKHYTSIILKHSRTSSETIEFYENWLDNYSK